jgi:glycine/D-amino acid oxidase-like deaminating enzyme
VTPVADPRALSVWFDTLPPDDLDIVRPPLGDVVEADVAIVGAGLTGLWSAYYLATADPSLRVVVLDAEVAGFGASGRNGGWCSGMLPVSMGDLAAQAGREGALAMLRAAQDTVDEVGRVCSAEHIDAQFAKGGYVRFATTPLQVQRLHQALAEERSWDQDEHDIRWLDRDAARARIGADGVFGALWTPHCAAVHPARLVRGLAQVVERLGVTIHEHSRVVSLRVHEARTEAGVVHARHVVRATEGYTPLLPGQRRAVLPMTSMVIATEPLPASFWDEVGWRSRDTFNDDRRFLVYAQRTADDRIVIGGRGAPYRFGSRISPTHERVDAVHDTIRSSLLEFFPQLVDAEITHRWGGTLGITRDWWPSVTREPDSGVITAGGYAGDGVALTNLAGRTVAAMVTDPSSHLLRLPWVGHRSPAWEPEPLRWVGINAGMRLARSIDAKELVSGRPANRRDRIMRRITGGH